MGVRDSEGKECRLPSEFLTHTLNLQIFLHWWKITEVNVWAWVGGVTQGVDRDTSGHTMSAYAKEIVRHDDRCNEGHV